MFIGEVGRRGRELALQKEHRKRHSHSHEGARTGRDSSPGIFPRLQTPPDGCLAGLAEPLPFEAAAGPKRLPNLKPEPALNMPSCDDEAAAGFGFAAAGFGAGACDDFAGPGAFPFAAEDAVAGAAVGAGAP